jgi:3',5'-cyclic AMP phosphodiesterase CpdA
MKLAWLTDIHLDHLWPRKEKSINTTIPKKLDDFFELIRQGDYDATIISGDIALAGHPSIPNYFLDTEFCIKYLTNITKKPVYFILGNL